MARVGQIAESVNLLDIENNLSKIKKYTSQVFFSAMWPTFTESGNYFLDYRNYGDYFLNSSSIICTWNVLKCNQNSSSWLFDGVCVFPQVSILSKLKLPYYVRKYFQMFNLLQQRVNPTPPPLWDFLLKYLFLVLPSSLRFLEKHRKLQTNLMNVFLQKILLFASIIPFLHY